MHYGACHATKGDSDFHTIKEGNKKQEQNIIHHGIREREREARKMKMKVLTAALSVVVLLCCLDVAFGYNRAPYYAAGMAGTVYHTLNTVVLTTVFIFLNTQPLQSATWTLLRVKVLQFLE